VAIGAGRYSALERLHGSLFTGLVASVDLEPMAPAVAAEAEIS
jgi:hypothetical protein